MSKLLRLRFFAAVVIGIFGIAVLKGWLPYRDQAAASLKPYTEITYPAPKLSDKKKQAKPAPDLMLAPAQMPTGLQAEKNRSQLDETYGKLPLRFEANEGQTTEEVKFLSRGPGYTLFLTATETVMVVREGRQNPTTEFLERKLRSNRAPTGIFAELRQHMPISESRSVLRMKLVGASSEAPVSGLKQLPGTTNYFIGNDPGKWRTGIRSYTGVKYSNIYPGVDLVYYGNGNQMEYDFVVAPGADAHAIQMLFEGADSIEIDSAGNLLMKVSGHPLKLRKPIVYQEIAGIRKELSGSYIFDGQSRLVGFDLARFDSSRPVIIDPVLEYSTLLGGTGGEVGTGIAVDANGSAYIAGETYSIDFPTTPGAIESRFRGIDAFVLKLSPDGSALEYATYLGGSDFDQALGIAVDTHGNAYVTGDTWSGDFPTTLGAFQEACPPPVGNCWPGFVFVTKLNSTGTALVYSSYLGGRLQAPGALGFSNAGGIAVDGAGHAYVTGQVAASNFPTTAGAFQTGPSGSGDAFVAKFAVDGSSLIYSTYLGGSTEDFGMGIAIDSDGNAFVTGYTGHPFRANDFPTTPGSFQPEGSTEDAFVTKLNPSGTALVYSTLLGGSQTLDGAWAYFDVGFGIAVDAQGSVYVTGKTWSSDFPVLNPPAELNKPLSLGSYSFITKFKPDGSGLVYSTYLAPGTGGGVVVDSKGNAYVAGWAYPQWFPYVNRLPSNFGDAADVAVMKLDPSGSVLLYSLTLGDWFNDYAEKIALDAAGNAYITGRAISPKFPITNSLLPAYSGGGGAFIAKISETTKTADLSVVAISGKLQQTETREIRTVYSITVHNYGPDDAEKVTLDESVFDFYPTTLLSYAATQGSCGNLTGRIFCELGRIRSGQSVDVQWVVTTTTPVMPVTVRSATEADPEPSNNSASLETWDLSGRYIWVFNSLGGSGRVVSDPPGIDCADDYRTCIHYYEADTVVTLTPIPTFGYRLLQWNGACSGSGTAPCTITIKGHLRDGYINVDPQFDLIDPTAITFDPSGAFNGEVGVPYADDPVFQGGVPPYSVQVVRGSLPSGLQVSSDYGITGTPTQSGRFAFTLQVTDRFGRSAAKAFRMNIYPALRITTTTLKSGATEKKYNAALKTAGGQKPYNWSIVGGSLPVGLTFNGEKGVISGKPQQAGLYNLTFQVVDPLGGTVQKNFTLTIN